MADIAAVDSPQREGTRAWQAHIGFEQSNVARVERADLLVFLVVFVVDDRPPGHVYCQRGVGSSGARGTESRRGTGNILRTTAQAIKASK